MDHLGTFYLYVFGPKLEKSVAIAAGHIVHNCLRDAVAAACSVDLPEDCADILFHKRMAKHVLIFHYLCFLSNRRPASGTISESIWADALAGADQRDVPPLCSGHGPQQQQRGSWHHTGDAVSSVSRSAGHAAYAAEEVRICASYLHRVIAHIRNPHRESMDP